MEKEYLEFKEKVNTAIKKSNENLIREKKEKGHDLIVSENGKIVRIPAKDL